MRFNEVLFLMRKFVVVPLRDKPENQLRPKTVLMLEKDFHQCKIKIEQETEND